MSTFLLSYFSTFLHKNDELVAYLRNFCIFVPEILLDMEQVEFELELLEEARDFSKAEVLRKLYFENKKND